MKLDVLQNEFVSGLNAVIRSTNKKSKLAVLQNVLVEASDDIGHLGLTLAATNLEMGVIVQVHARVKEAGRTTVPARQLLGLAKELSKNEPVSLSANGGSKLELQSGKTKNKLNTIDASEFPVMDIKGDLLVSLPAATFRQAIRQVVKAVATDDTRPAMTGVQMTGYNGTVILRATDGYVFARREFAVPSLGAGFQVIVPAKAMEEVARHLGNDGDVDVLLDGERISFRYGPVTVFALLIDGNFPDADSVIPKSFRTTMTVSTAELVQAVRVANVFAKDRDHALKLELINRPGESSDVLTVSAEADTGSDAIELDAAIVDGPGLELHMNALYLQDALGIVTTPRVLLMFTDPLGPMMIQNEGEGSWLYLVMPLNLKNRR